MIEDFKEDISNSLKEIQENRGKQKLLKRKQTIPLKNKGKYDQIDEGIAQNH